MSLYKQKYNPLTALGFNLVPTSTAIVFKEAVDSVSNLPPTGNTQGDARFTTDTGHLYIWDGSQWIDQGDIIDFQWSAIADKPSSSVANIDDAVSKRHTQGTDQGLDTGGVNATTAAQVKTAVTNSHAPNSDNQDLSGKVDKVTGSSLVPDSEISKIHAAHSDDQIIPDQLSDLSDDATHRLVTDDEKSIWNQISDVALNVMLNAFRIAQIGSLTIFNMVKGFMDEYENESGIDLGNSNGQIYDSDNDFYKNYDDLDAETVLLLHLNNNVTDSELTPKTVTNTDVTFSAPGKFGSHAAVFNGTTSYLSVPDSTDWDFGTGDLTVECWVKFSTLTGYQTLISQGSDPTHQMYLSKDSNDRIWFYQDNSIIDSGIFTTTAPSFVIDTWYHIAAVRSGTTGYIFLNGVSLPVSQGGSGPFGTANLGGFSAPLKIGVHFNNGTPLNGSLDEVRISKGIVRWTSNFTPPTVEYPIEDNMILQSNVQVATIIPVSSRIVLFEEDVDSITLNTDLKAYISRDNGTTFSQVTLEDEGNYITGARILSGVVDISAQPSGSNMKYKIETLNLKKLNIHGTSVSWK